MEQQPRVRVNAFQKAKSEAAVHLEERADHVIGRFLCKKWITSHRRTLVSSRHLRVTCPRLFASFRGNS
jgi:hypothetical protein